MPTIARRTLRSVLALALLALAAAPAVAADTLATLRLDYAYYNPVSLVLGIRG